MWAKDDNKTINQAHLYVPRERENVSGDLIGRDSDLKQQQIC